MESSSTTTMNISPGIGSSIFGFKRKEFKNQNGHFVIYLFDHFLRFENPKPYKFRKVFRWRRVEEFTFWKTFFEKLNTFLAANQLKKCTRHLILLSVHPSIILLWFFILRCIRSQWWLRWFNGVEMVSKNRFKIWVQICLMVGSQGRVQWFDPRLSPKVWSQSSLPKVESHVYGGVSMLGRNLPASPKFSICLAF